MIIRYLKDMINLKYDFFVLYCSKLSFLNPLFIGENKLHFLLFAHKIFHFLVKKRKICDTSLLKGINN